jgi:SAM-dependent methyltransferase
MITPEQFLDLLLDELRQNPKLTSYYKFLNSELSFGFRKNYFCQRLHYILKHLPKDRPITIWDCGCGYGTTAIFLSLNGIPVYGTTLEFYFEIIEERLAYWKQHGDVSLFTYAYENLLDTQMQASSVDVILVQDTLHHLEPMQEVLEIFHKVLRPKGCIMSIEENGDNILQRTRRYIERGNNRIITFYDEKLQKDILIGNENIRSLATWKHELAQAKFKVPEESVQYIRFYPAPFYKLLGGYDKVLAKEANKGQFWKDYFFFGLNFIAEKQV